MGIDSTAKPGENDELVPINGLLQLDQKRVLRNVNTRRSHQRLRPGANRQELVRVI